MIIKSPDTIKVFAQKKEKNKKLRIHIDIDGVLSDWDRAAAKTCNIDIKDEKIRKEMKEGKDIDDIIGKNKIWKLIDKEGEDWWVNLDKFEWADNLVKLISEKTENFCFLTSPSDNPLCASGKLKWIKKHFPKYSRKIIITPQKYMCATPDSILIDDSKKKTDKFQEFGGSVFLWPHSLKIIDKDIKIEDVLSDLSETIDKIG